MFASHETMPIHTSEQQATNHVESDVRLPANLRAAWTDAATLLRYVAVGGASAVVEFLVFSGLVYLSGTPVLAANMVAIGVVITFSFISHKHFTFRNRGAHGRQLRLYLTMLAVSVLLNNLLVYLFAIILGWPSAVAKFLQIGICFIWNYSVSRIVVFSSQH